MVLVPEFFTLMGIVVFLGLSFVSWLLDDHLPRFFPYVFQGAAAAGLGALFLSQGLVSNGSSLSSTVNPTRLWISILYLTASVSCLLGLNLHLATTRDQGSHTRVFSGFITGPTLLISTVLISAYLGTGGQADLPPATILVLGVLGFGISYGFSSFIREAMKRSTGPRIKKLKPPKISMPQPSAPFSLTVPSLTPSRSADGWETAPQNKEEEK